MAGVYGCLNSRADFYRALEQAYSTANDYLARAPDDIVFQSITRQLQAIKEWTADGHSPTDEQRNRLTIDQLVVREMNSGETGDVRMDAWAEQLSDLMNFIEGWPNDQQAANPPPDELRRLLTRQTNRKYISKAVP